MEGSSSTNQAPPKEPSSHRQTIVLHVLSPSVEVPNKITFPVLPIAMTIGELKYEICDKVASRPRPERQRLIYRGKALVQENLTLREVFSQDTVRLILRTSTLQANLQTQIDNSESLSLHLVLPPTAGAHTNSSVTSVNPAHNHLNNPQHSMPSRTGSPAQPQGAQAGAETTQPTAPVGSAPQANPIQPQMGRIHLPPGQLPPHLQQVINHQVQALFQHQIQAAQGAIAGQTLPGGVPQIPVQARQWQQSGFPQIIAQQQQARAAAGLQGLGGAAMNQVLGSPAPHIHLGAPGAVANTPIPAPAPGTTTRTVREDQGPNGEWRVVVESTSIISNNNNNQAGTVERPIPGLLDSNVRASPAPGNGRPQTSHTAGPSGVSHTNQPQANGAPLPDTLPLFQQHLAALESTLASGTAPAESIFQQTQARLDSMANQPGTLPAGAEATLRARLNNLSIQADQLRASLTSLLMRVVAEQPQPPPQQLPQPASSSAVYVLSSPSGPQALLVSPSGLYSTPWPHPATIHGLFPTVIPPPPLPTVHPQPPTAQLADPNAQQPPANNANPQQAQQIQQEQQNQEQANQARDLLRILLPLGGHLWLFIRLFGFVYFFTAGGSYRRTILLGLCAFLVFVAQTGIFRPLLEHVWEPIRHHAASLLPIGTNEQMERVLRNDQVGYRIPPDQEPTVENAQRRLLELEQRVRGDETHLRGMFRRVERAIALFIASLVPGVGERHMAARGAAEVLARHERELREEVEEQERESQERIEERIRSGVRGNSGYTDDEDEEEGGGSGGATAAAESSVMAGEGSSNASARAGEGSSGGAQGNQRPLVEI